MKRGTALTGVYLGIGALIAVYGAATGCSGGGGGISLSSDGLVGCGVGLFIGGFIGLAILLYLLPSYIALLRGADRSGSVVVLNVLGGWTLWGWIQSLIWAMGPRAHSVAPMGLASTFIAESSMPSGQGHWGPVATNPPTPDLREEAEGGAGPTPELVVRTLGGFQLQAAGRDLTSELLSRPVVSFLWLWLLVRAVVDRSAPVLRESAAEEMFPNQSRSTQLERFRARLHSLRTLAAPLAKRIQVDGETVSFILEGCSIDILELRTLVNSFADGPVLSQGQVEAAERLVRSTAGEILPLWETLDERVTQGRGASADLIAAYRAVAETNRIQLLLVLARHHLSWRRPAAAAALLEEAAAARPDRDDIRELLAASSGRQ